MRCVSGYFEQPVETTYLQLVLEQILLVGQLAIEAEEALLVCRERL